MHAATRTAVWCALLLSAAANAVTSFSGGSQWLAAGFGLVTLSCAIALVTDHIKRRRA
ncbi:hypothetical protein AB0M46_39590 [Dactylosporangium sp. NPDC051485]|uniref:hypothetical protein n=1 Tax=Dactylosporangium sp. NPDC051485 TaxID=3154846 RepID=UPI003443DEDB